MPVQLLGADIVRATVFAFLNGQVSMNRFHYVVQGAGSGTVTDLDFVSDWSINAGNHLKDIMSSAALFLGATAQVINRLSMPVRQTDTAGAGAGGRAATPCPTVVCGLTEWLSPIAKPAGRGRTFWPFPAVDDVDTNSQPKGVFIAAMGTLSGRIINYTSVTGVAGILPVQLTLHNAAGLPRPNFTGFQVQHKWASLHKRGAYGKLNISPL